MDFLTRLVDRQRGGHIGVRPVLPSRYESESAGPSHAEAAVPPVQHGPCLRLSARPSGDQVLNPTMLQRDSSHEPDPVPQSPSAVDVVRLTGALLPATNVERVADPPALSHAIGEPAERPTAARQHGPHLDADAQRQNPARHGKFVSVDAVAQQLPAPSLPQPMLEPAHPYPVAVEVPARRPTADPTTVTISIGRVELRAPSTPPAPPPSAESPSAPPRSAHQPRLTLEDYLAQPNRGRR
jgi:hypothetical protein